MLCFAWSALFFGQNILHWVKEDILAGVELFCLGIRCLCYFCNFSHGHNRNSAADGAQQQVVWFNQTKRTFFLFAFIIWCQIVKVVELCMSLAALIYTFPTAEDSTANEAINLFLCCL